MTIADTKPQTTTPTQSRRPDLEQMAAIAGTAVAAVWLVLTTFNAGPLWRDETNSINLAQMPSLEEFWHNLPFESFPPFWLLLLRGLSFLGMASSDASIRMLGLFVGLGFLGSLWLCARWTTGRPPIVSLALVGTLPAFVATVVANRAYGLAMCLLVLTFGTIWRMVELPSRARIIWAGFVSLLFVHCVYYDVVFLGAILAGAALVAARRRAWKILTVLMAIGSVAGLSLVIYLPIIHRTSIYTQMVQVPFFSFSTIWEKFSEAVSFQSSAHWGPSGGPEPWVWLSLLATGVVLTIAMQFRRARRVASGTPMDCGGKRSATPLWVGCDEGVEEKRRRASLAAAVHTFHETRETDRADLALFSGAALFCGVAGYFLFLLQLRFPTQPWYYMGVLSLYAISLEGVFSAIWPGLRPAAIGLGVGGSTDVLSTNQPPGKLETASSPPPLSEALRKTGHPSPPEEEREKTSSRLWGLLRVGFLAVMILCSVRPMWEEGHTRRSNVDVIAAVIGNQAVAGDLVIVQSAWEGVTFDRYYHGQARWMTVPPLESHKVHRTDLMWAELNQQDAMAPVLSGINDTLRNGGRVWVAGAMQVVAQLPPAPPPPPHPQTKWYLGPYYRYWAEQLSTHLIANATQTRIMKVTLPVPVNARENLPLLQFSGYRAIADRPNPQQPASGVAQ